MAPATGRPVAHCSTLPRIPPVSSASEEAGAGESDIATQADSAIEADSATDATLEKALLRIVVAMD